MAESYYGTPAWNCYWSLLNTDGNITWVRPRLSSHEDEEADKYQGPDPLLTPLGEEQAAAANAGWKEQIKDGAPLPQVFYSSPFRRAASTLDITWRDILLNKGYLPVIKEQWRENIGLHTCDARSNKSVIAETYRESPSSDLPLNVLLTLPLYLYCLTLMPAHFTFEPSFTEHDPYWDATYIETDTQRAVRMRMALNDIFANDARTFISITCHSGVINAFFLATGHRPFQVQTGGFVPVVLKAVSHPTATFSAITRGQSGTAPACTADPAPASLVTARKGARVSVQPTWYPACSETTCDSSGAVTGTWEGAAPTAT